MLGDCNVKGDLAKKDYLILLHFFQSKENLSVCNYQSVKNTD